MIEVYYYIRKDEADMVAECGMSLLKWHSRVVQIGDTVRKCIPALLNPRDDMSKYKSPEFKCLKLKAPAESSYIAEKYYYDAGMDDPRMAKLYCDSVIPLRQYVFGTYRLPECLITITLLPGGIDPVHGGLDSPVLFSNSEELYLNNIIELNKEEDDSFSDALLYHYFKYLADRGLIEAIFDNTGRIAVFIDSGKGRTYVIKKPE